MINHPIIISWKIQLKILFNSSSAESDQEKKIHYQTRATEYLKRAELIKTEIQSWSSRGEIKDKICILEGATNFGYERIFGKYMNDDVKEILIEEPYVKEFYQVMTLGKLKTFKFLKFVFISHRFAT